MTTFLLIRHGETDAVGKSLMGWAPGWRLNETGRRQVERLSKRLTQLPLRAVYTSPLERARETAESIARPHGVAWICKRRVPTPIKHLKWTPVLV